LADAVLDLLKGFGTELFGIDSTVLSAFTNRAPAPSPQSFSRSDHSDSLFECIPSQFSEDVFDRKLDPEYEFAHKFTRGYPTLAERYAERRNELHVHFAFCDCQYCAVFYRPLMDKGVTQKGVINAECSEIDGCRDQVEMAMLLDVSQTVEESEMVVRAIRTRSVVRLQFLDSCPHRGAQSGHSTLDAFRREIIGACADGESGLTARGGTVRDDKLPREIVQSAAKIAENITEAERKLLGRHVRLTANAPRMLRSFGIKIVNNHTWIRKTESADGETKGVHVLVRPYQLGLETV
jgi:hypothetical protein